MRAETHDEARRVLFLCGEQVGERDAGVRTVGGEESGVERVIVFRRLLVAVQLPGEQPRVGDAMGVEVGDEAVFVALVPADVLVGVNETRGSGQDGKSLPRADEGAKGKPRTRTAEVE
jgi:hypothetical protein